MTLKNFQLALIKKQNKKPLLPNRPKELTHLLERHDLKTKLFVQRTLLFIQNKPFFSFYLSLSPPTLTSIEKNNAGER